ncbi:MAG: response regulator [Verrucomicrobiota bacterium]
MNIAKTDIMTKRLLVVDDEDGPRQSLNMIFSDDYDVTIATSGEEAIRFSSESPFHVVLTDIRMRGLSGIDVLREVKKLDSNTEVIVLTAYETLETARQAISLGASEYLKKPFDIEHIQNVVDRCFENYLFTTRQDAVIRKDVNAAKTNFLEIVSHELNTPMNGIVGFIELLQETKLDTDQTEYVEMIHDCSLKYFEHVQDILTYAKISMSDCEISRSSFNPATMLLKQIFEAVPREGVELTHEITESMPEFVMGPEQEIRIVLRKLLLNALKFTESGTINVSLDAVPLGGGHHIFTFTVADTGPGIEEGLIKGGKIFDAFTQGDSSLKRAHEGLGLGLSLCKSLSDRLNGELSVESIEGEGSTFCFRFELSEGSS